MLLKDFIYKILYNDSRKLRTIYKLLLILLCLFISHAICEFTDYIKYKTEKVYIVTSNDSIYHIYDWCHFANDEIKTNNGNLLEVKLYQLDNFNCCKYCQDYYETKIEIQNHK